MPRRIRRRYSPVAALAAGPAGMRLYVFTSMSHAVLTLRSDSLFWVTWVIEQYAQFDAAMPCLWKVRGTRIPRVQIRRGVVRWEQHLRHILDLK